MTFTYYDLQFYIIIAIHITLCDNIVSVLIGLLKDCAYSVNPGEK